MKKITAFLICLALTVTMFAWSEEEYSDQAHSTQHERIYITPNHLQFNNSDMYVFHNDAWIQVFAVYSDNEGLFVECKQASPETWYCIDCRTYHNRDQKCPQAPKDQESRKDKKRR